MDQFKDYNEMYQEYYKIAEMFHIAFSTDAGKKVLDHLYAMMDQSHLASNAMMDAQANVNPDQFMCIREGQNQVYRYIDKLMRYYEENRNG